MKVLVLLILVLLASVAGSRLMRKAGGFRGLLRMLADFTGIGARSRVDQPKLRRADMNDLDQRMKARGERLREILAMAEDEANHQATVVLAQPNSWHLGERTAEAIRPFVRIHPSVRQILEHYSSIESPTGSSRLDVTLISQFYWPGRDTLEFSVDPTLETEQFWEIGRDSDGSPVVVKSREPTVYVVHKGSGPSSPAWSNSYPSVHHWVLAKHADSELGS